MPGSFPKFSILNVAISACDLDRAAGAIDGWIRERKPVYICVAPVSTIVAGHDDPEYLRILNGADLVTPDGMPLVWLARWRRLSQVSRTYGPDLMRKVCAQGCPRGYRHFILGGTTETNEKLVHALQRDYPGILIVGRAVPPFRDLSAAEEDALIRRINDSGADILWVGLGSPKQDFWMARNRAKLRVPVLIAVGAAFDFIAGTKPQAPRWMQKSGLEWVFRLGCEPQRLWHRYLWGNSRFVFLLIKEGLMRKSQG